MGGFVNFILKFTAMLLNRYQNFTIDKSMIKKLYTKVKDSPNQVNKNRRNIYDLT